MSISRSNQLGATLLFLASLMGLAVSLYAYVTPLTGVTGTLGALVAILACVALAVMALLLALTTHRGVNIALRIFIFIGLAGTCLAGVLLHQWWLVAAMAIGLLGLILDITFSTPSPAPSLRSH